MNYFNIDQLKNASLNLYDNIIFNINHKNYMYQVYPTYLRIMSTDNLTNDEIFKRLGYINELSIHKLGEKIYGYNIRYGTYFPETKYKDFDALKKIALFLYQQCQLLNNEDCWE